MMLKIFMLYYIDSVYILWWGTAPPAHSNEMSWNKMKHNSIV